MARTTAIQRGETAPERITAQQTLDYLMKLGIDGPRGMRIMAIARQYGEKAEALDRGIVFVRPAGDGYTIEVSRRARQ